MADISVTAASVLKGSGAATSTGITGSVAITAGQPLYVDSTNNNTLKPADADGSLLAATVVGIALHASSPGQPITYQTGGLLTLNAVLTFTLQCGIRTTLRHPHCL